MAAEPPPVVVAEEPPVVVVDTSVYLRATINAANVSSSLLRRAEAGEIQLCVSPALLEEVRDVLTRPEIRAKNARLTEEALGAFLSEVPSQARLMDPLPSHIRYARDPDDEHVLNLAIEAHAAYLVSFDNDLLDLMHPDREEARAFQQQYPHLTILMPGELLTRLNLLRAQNEPQPEHSPEADPTVRPEHERGRER